MTEPASVIVVDDHALFRMGVSQTIALNENLRVVAEGASRQDSLDLVALHQPAIVLLDISMPGGGVAAAREIHERWPDVKVVMLTVSEDDEDVLEALEAGASGYILKGIAAKELIDALTTVQRGSTYLSPTMGSKLVAAMKGRTQSRTDGDPFSELSVKERNVLECVGRGMGNQAIAAETGTTLRTVKFHVSRLLRKLDAKNRIELALIAQKISEAPRKNG
ncbi:response regulator transcription factor [Rhizobium cauense]|uniref:response regulator n=1 Tax=Rhizobium cauense TaxID=1166683 RepID=UPI001C6E6B55|nr:response regulator transcription factor [Rhizobium cauense]MBW9117392.1 response regulator transcription factor [Rhizobium cauense]